MDKSQVKLAKKQLSKDPIMREVVKNYAFLELPKSKTVFHELVKSIVFQQISYKAAENIHGRFVKLMRRDNFSAKAVLSKTEEELRSVGLSYQKVNYIKNIATNFIKKKYRDKDWEDKSEADILRELTEIKGVGEWTVQMILLFQLERPDVFPVKDLGIQIAMKALFDIKSEKKELLTDMTHIAESWRPYRSIASRYLWAWKREN